MVMSSIWKISLLKPMSLKKPLEDTNSETPPIIGGQSASADQARAHFNKDDEKDYMKKVSVPFGGDQMTRVRFAGAKDLRAGANTAKHHFDHCCPFVAELSTLRWPMFR